jgi:hypothetical protein
MDAQPGLSAALRITWVHHSAGLQSPLWPLSGGHRRTSQRRAERRRSTPRTGRHHPYHGAVSEPGWPERPQSSIVVPSSMPTASNGISPVA